MENTVKFEKISFGKRTGSMLKVDFRRMFRSKLFYILIASALIMPILMTVMMAMMDGSVSVDPQTGAETIMQGPENTWQNIGTLPGESLGGDEIFMMCNINMAFMGVAVFVCLFISDDFRSGYAKNLFTVRAKRGEYVVSKTISGFICGALMLIAYLVGAILGGASRRSLPCGRTAVRHGAGRHRKSGAEQNKLGINRYKATRKKRLPCIF